MITDTFVIETIGDVLTAIDLRSSQLSYQKIGASEAALDVIRQEQQTLFVLRSSLDNVQLKLVRSGLALNTAEYVKAKTELEVASAEARMVLAQLEKANAVVSAVQKVLAIGVKIVSLVAAAV